LIVINIVHVKYWRRRGHSLCAHYR